MIKKENKIIVAVDNEITLLDSANPDQKILQSLLEELIVADAAATLVGNFILDEGVNPDMFTDMLLAKGDYYELKPIDQIDNFLSRLMELYVSSWGFQLFKVSNEMSYAPADLDFSEQGLEELMSRGVVITYLVMDDFSELLVYKHKSIDETNRVYQKLNALKEL